MRARRVLLIAILAACGDAGGGDDTPPGSPDAARADSAPLQCPTVGRYLGLATGASWVYRVSNGVAVETKTQTVGPLEDVGGAKAGTVAFRMTTTRIGGSTVSWQEDTGTAVVRHRELDQAGANQSDTIYQPSKLRLDEAPAHLTAGATWTLDYTEIATDMAGTTTVAKSETWNVVATEEEVDVPAGHYCALHLHRTSQVNGMPMTGSDKDYWFVHGIGKVKELGAGGDTEELSSFTPP